MDDKATEFINYGSKLLINCIVVCLLLVFLSQGLLIYNPFPLKISLIDKIEGEKLNNYIIHPTGNMELGVNYITFKLLNPYIKSLPNGKIYVNNNLRGDFSTLQNTINVEFGDIITLDFKDYSLDIVLKVLASDNIEIEKETIKIMQGIDYSIQIKEAN